MGHRERQIVRRRRRWFGFRPIVLVIAAAIVGGFLIYQRCGVHGCPNVDQLSAYQPGGESTLLDARGEKVADLAPIQHAVVRLESLPEHLPAAFVAIEDKRFFEHNGVDYRRAVGALVADIKAVGFVQGFSTITMQIAGSIWRERVRRSRKTIGRKLVEIRLAREIERKYSKQEILELYLNNIYFGGGAYGVEAAARNYFGKSARNVTVAEAATLAALPKSPVIYDPRRNPRQATRRRDLVIAMMAEQGSITDKQAERAVRTKLSVRRDPPARRKESLVAPYFVDAVRRELEDHFGEDLYTAPLRVYTTLDRTAQRAAEQELARQLGAVESGVYGRYRGARYSARAEPADETEYVQGAVVVINARTGAVLAHVGGRDFRQSRFDRVTRARRQAGSAFKPFVYATALSEGYAPSQHVLDAPLKMELAGGEIWEPRNFTNDFRGEITLRDALVTSRNVATIRLAADVGVRDVARTARQSGIGSTIPGQPSMAIGTAAVTPIELARAYTPFATLGKSMQPRWVARVEDEAGRTVWRPKVKQSAALDRGVAYLVTDMLRDAVRHGTGAAVRRAGYEGPAAGKTGTTNDGADAWFVGYTPELVSVVWIGFDQPKSIVSGASGGRLAAPVWGRIMQRIYASRPAPDSWTRPESVVEKPVDPATGMLLTKGCRPERGDAGEELFLDDELPASTCPRGEPADERPGIFARAFAWVRSSWYSASAWVASHVGSERKREEEPARKRYLGVPKLPTAKAPPPKLLGEPLVEEPAIDTADFALPRIDPETLLVDPDPVMVDTVTPDTVAADTVTADSILN
jgi:penicillin-binding protein 1A